MFGLGKRRTKLGKYCDRYGITQTWLSDKSKVNYSTIAELCDGNKDVQPQEKTIKKIISALRKNGHNVDSNDFWM